MISACIIMSANMLKQVMNRHKKMGERMEIITNNNKQNHMGKLVQLSKEANMMIVVSAFISGNLSEIFDSMPTIKNVTIYTNLSGYSDGADKALSLFDFYQYCKKNKIDLIVKSDDHLHGKAYLFYHTIKDMPPEPRGFVISSGNFTQNGLRYNHEYGVIIKDSIQQNNLAKMIQDLRTCGSGHSHRLCRHECDK